ncbi:helix-turn-helix domain-containing protein [Nocardia sp. NBC_01327]|uniref:helix-turn-helix domain-containing protein n=1 Tax=Nocardia sp. NBC_01327 TaxID=2903593 RepID=UPI002E10C3E0|nr:helix-turn-helix domain-containing protein [Nocardia sp. NBC_01327]
MRERGGVIDAEYGKETFSTDDDDPAASWYEYLQQRQGSVRLGFGPDHFSSDAYAQNVGPFQVVRFTSWPSPGALLRTIRVERAHRRLSIALPVDMDRIAFEEGFPSTRRFRETYREHYGQTPAQMREQVFGGRLPRDGHPVHSGSQ